MSLVWSQQQIRIKVEFRDGKEHFVVIARAGVGKTTMIFEGVWGAPEKAIFVAAYNRKIADAGTARNTNPDTGLPINPAVEVNTIHSAGLRVVRKNWRGITWKFTDERAKTLTDAVCGIRCPAEIKKLVTELHTKGREMAPHARSIGDLTDIAIKFELTPEEGSRFDLNYVEDQALAAMDLAARFRPSTNMIDGSDMIYLPIRNRWLRPCYDMGVIDEAQDMTLAQLEIVQGLVEGRLGAVGDDRQAIYDFRGADSESLSRLQRELQAGTFPLTITYRCGTNIVDLAKTIVPDFEAGPNNPPGSVDEITPDKLIPMAQHGDFIVSRTRAPLMGIAMRLWKAGKRAKISGTDIGRGIVSLLRKFKAKSVTDLLVAIERWANQETAKYTAMMTEATERRKEILLARIEDVADQAEMLMELTEGKTSVDEVFDAVFKLFVDPPLGSTDADVVSLSTVHKAKGLEANRVFVLKDTLRNNNQEELNIQYVAITRAKNSLVFVPGIR